MGHTKCTKIYYNFCAIFFNFLLDRRRLMWYNGGPPSASLARFVLTFHYTIFFVRCQVVNCTNIYPKICAAFWAKFFQLPIDFWSLCVVSYICKVEKGKTHWFVKTISKNHLTKFGKYVIIVIENKKRITNEIETFIFSKKIKKILDK